MLGRCTQRISRMCMHSRFCQSHRDHTSTALIRCRHITHVCRRQFVRPCRGGTSSETEAPPSTLQATIGRRLSPTKDARHAEHKPFDTLHTSVGDNSYNLTVVAPAARPKPRLRNYQATIGRCLSPTKGTRHAEHKPLHTLQMSVGDSSYDRTVPEPAARPPPLLRH